MICITELHSTSFCVQLLLGIDSLAIVLIKKVLMDDTTNLSRHRAILEELLCNTRDRSDARIVSLMQMALDKLRNITEEHQNAVATRQPAERKELAETVEPSEPAATVEPSRCELCTEDPSASAATTLSEDLHFTIQCDDSHEHENYAGIYNCSCINYYKSNILLTV